MRTFLIALACSLALAAGTEDSFLLRGVTVHPVSSPEIHNGAVLVRDGKIAEAGSKLAAPKGVRVIDAKGLHVYPGMIDSATEIGLSEIGSVRETNDAVEMGDFNPQLRAIIAVNPATEHIPVTRANGITSVITMAAGGIISGQSALIHLDGWTWQEMGVSPSVCMNLRFPTIQTASSRFSTGSGRRAAVADARRNYEKRLQALHEFFEQARRYQKAKQAGAAGFTTDLKMEAMLPVIDRRLPVVIHAARERAIRDALQFADKEQIRVVLAGAQDSWKLTGELKARHVPVILGPTLELPSNEDDPYDKAYTLPAELYRAGVKIVFGTFSTSASRNLPYQAAMGVAFGLPYQEALKAVTLNAAEIWGMADQLGSIDKGKWADLIVTDGDPLETRTQVKHCFIKGRTVDLENKHHRLYEKYMSRQ